MLCSYLTQTVSYSSPAKYCSCNLSVEPFICTCLHCICIVLTKVKVLPERQMFYSCTELLNSALALSDSTKLSWIPFSLTLMLHSMLLLCLHLNAHTHTKMAADLQCPKCTSKSTFCAWRSCLRVGLNPEKLSGCFLHSSRCLVVTF